MAISAILDPVLRPLLSAFGPFWFVVLISLIVSLITVLAYKFTTDQKLMKQYKEEISKLQKEMKATGKDQQKMMNAHKQIMSRQMVMMKHSLTSTFITFLPIILLFGWLTSNLAYEPLTAESQFTISVFFDDYVGKAELLVPKGMTIVDDSTKDVAPKVDWRMSGESGEYLLEWKIDGKSYFKDVRINDEQRYAEPIKKINDNIVKTIQINYDKKKILPILGWGWLGTYILLAIVFSMLLRKLLRVY
jgi:uncharacterized membrane protein (DUF106 family)